MPSSDQIRARRQPDALRARSPLIWCQGGGRRLLPAAAAVVTCGRVRPAVVLALLFKPGPCRRCPATSTSAPEAASDEEVADPLRLLVLAVKGRGCQVSHSQRVCAVLLARGQPRA